MLGPSSFWSSQHFFARNLSIPLQSWGDLASVRLKDLPNDTHLVSWSLWDLMRCIGPPYGFRRISGESRPSHLVLKAFPLRSGLRLPSSGIPLFGLLHQTYLRPIWGQAVHEDMSHLPSPSQQTLHVQALALGDLLSHQPHPHPPASSVISATRTLSSQLPILSTSS